MDHQHAKQIVEQALVHLRAAMQLQQWEISLVFGEIEGEDGIAGQCTCNYPYRKAIIELDLDRHQTEDELLETLRHELLHILGWGFDQYRRVVGYGMRKDKFDQIDSVYGDASESMVWHIEQMLTHGLGLTARQMVELREKAEKYAESSEDINRC